MKAAGAVAVRGDPAGVNFLECDRLAAPDTMLDADARWQDLVPQHRAMHSGKAKEAV